MTTKTVICPYCDTQNPVTSKFCLACGAPIEQQPTAKKKTPAKPEPEKRPEEELREVGEKIDEAYFTVLNTYAIAWRTVGEAIAIAVAGFVVGLAGGATGMGWWGILGAAIVGVAVGITQKNFYVVLVSAPGGAIIGLGVGAILSIMGLPGALSFVVAGCAIFGAVVGGKRRIVYNRRNWWEKLRPFLGALGGFSFGILGVVLGRVIQGLLSLFE